MASPRRIISEPAAVLEGLERELADFRALAAELAERQAIAGGHAPGIEPALVRYFETTFPRRIAEMRRAREEADEIRRLIDVSGADYSLRRHLRDRPITPECLAWLLADHRRLSRSLAASFAAQNKNADARRFVAAAWLQRSDLEQSRAAFAREVRHEVKRRFGVDVTADRIARYWLPKP